MAYVVTIVYKRRDSVPERMREHRINTVRALVWTAALLLCVALGLPAGATATQQSAAVTVEDASGNEVADVLVRYSVSFEPDARIHAPGATASVDQQGSFVVDISGELLGDLYRQGREIAAFMPGDTEGYVADAPMVRGPQPYKGMVFPADWNSGACAVKITDRPRAPTGDPHD